MCFWTVVTSFLLNFLNNPDQYAGPKLEINMSKTCSVHEKLMSEAMSTEII